ncbi:MAG: phosphoribosylaminoimidazolesuccinocarboxamide synthase [Elusimicrobiota bacterium]
MKLIYQGKVRDVYELDADRLLFVASDRVSAFDWVLPDLIPDKGKVLAQISTFWFEKTRHIVANHVLDAKDVELPKESTGRSMVVRKAKIFPYEFIVRAHLAGSGWKAYQRRVDKTGNLSVIASVAKQSHKESFEIATPQQEIGARNDKQDWISALPAGLRFGDLIPGGPVLTPTTKENERGKHDEDISWPEVETAIGKPAAAAIKKAAMDIFTFAYDYLKQRGVVLVDTKFELGTTPDGKIILCDEVLTPDSSRFWWAKDFRPGTAIESLDKQQVRNYLELTLKWDKKPPVPHLSKEIITKTREVYFEAFRAVTGGEPRL